MKKLLFFTLLILLVSGCSKLTTDNKNVPAGENIVLVSHFVFEPSELVVDAGTTVTWKHDDSVTHTIVSQGLFESKALIRGEEFSFTFTNQGEYDYYCSIHPSMKGRIIVK